MIFGRIRRVCEYKRGTKVSKPYTFLIKVAIRPSLKQSRFVLICFKSATLGGLYHRQSNTLPYKQTEDRKHGTKVVQTNDAGPARAGTD